MHAAQSTVLFRIIDYTQDMTDSSKIVRAPVLAFFKDKKVLMVQPEDEEVFFFIGGGIEEGESDSDCLIREVKEEINCELDPASITFLAEFEDAAHSKVDMIVQLPMYTASITGTPKPSREIIALEYFDSSVDPKLLSAVAVNKVFPWLKEKGLIN